jgi:NTP pyrophosphatase (non-canonical NTP hydrolase)
MLTNEKIATIHANAVAHGFWEPGSEPTFGEYCALIHEEISEAFSAWRNNEPDEYVVDGKPEGVWVELADVVIRCADLLGVLKQDVEPWTDSIYPKVVDYMRALDEEKFAEYISMLHNFVTNAHESASNNLLNVYIRIEYIITCIYAMANARNIDLDAIIERKCAYNATRPYKHGKRM